MFYNTVCLYYHSCNHALVSKPSMTLLILKEKVNKVLLFLIKAKENFPFINEMCWCQ